MSIPASLEQMKKFQVITLFPDMFTGVFENSMMWKAQKDKIVELSTIDLREFGLGPRRSVDDTPYGGGDGMLLMVEPLWNAVQKAKENGAVIISVNPLPETGLLGFSNPQTVKGAIGVKARLTDHFLQVKINSDMALLKAITLKLIEKENLHRPDFAGNPGLPGRNPYAAAGTKRPR